MTSLISIKCVLVSHADRGSGGGNGKGGRSSRGESKDSKDKDKAEKEAKAPPLLAQYIMTDEVRFWNEVLSVSALGVALLARRF